MRRFLVLSAATIVLSGCEVIGGIGDRTVAPELEGNAGSSGSGASGASGQSTGGAGHGNGGEATGGSAGEGGSLGGSAGVAGSGGAGQAGAPGGAGAGGASGQAGEGGAGGSAQGGAGGEAGSSGQGGTTVGGQGGVGGGAAGIGGAGGSAGTSGAAGQGGGPVGCALTHTTATGARVANLVPTTDLVDFCIKPHSAPDWTSVKPVLRGAGSACPAGFGYEEVSAAFDIAAGLVDVKAIASTAQDCTDPGIATLGSAVVGASVRTDFYLMGDAANRAIYHFVESPPQPFSTAFRLIPAVQSGDPIDVGLASASSTPATLTQVMFQSLAFATAPTTSQLGSVDANGYLQVNLGGSDLDVGVAPTGTTDASYVRTTSFKTGAEHTMFLVGTPSDVRFPEELLLCDELTNDDNGYLAVCNGGSTFAQSVTFGTFNAQLTGSFTIDVDERRQPIIDRLSMDDADVLCIGELWNEADKQALVQAAATSYPYHVEMPSTYTMPAVADPTDQMGNVPPDYTNPPCAGTTATQLDSLVDCVRDKCSTIAGSENATVIEGPCASNPDSAGGCQSEFIPLVFASDKSCYSCALVQIQSFQTMADIRTACKTDPTARYAYGGNNGQVLLSKHKLGPADVTMLPATEWRVAVLHAPLELENGATVDVFCTTLTTPAGNSITRPYVGQYGGGATGGTAWANENLLQAQKLEALVQAKAGSHPTVVMGEFYAGPDYTEGSTQVLQSITPMTFQSLATTYAIGVAPDYTPACTFCSANPLVGGMNDYWESHIFLKNIPVTAVTATTRHFTENVVPITSGGMTSMVPLSTHYGLRSTIVARPLSQRMTEDAGSAALVGQTLAGKYEIVALVAKGGMGHVYRATQLPLGRTVAVKVLTPPPEGSTEGLADEASFQKRFFLEANTLSRLQHPNIVALFDYGKVDGPSKEETYFMTMEYVHGETLLERLKTARALPPKSAIGIARQIAKALRVAHGQKIVHRDLKPSNVMLSPQGDGDDLVKVVDFGIVKVLSDDPTQLTRAGTFLGSPKYISPEQVRGLSIDHRSDVYSLGVIVFQMLTGTTPFSGASVDVLSSHVRKPPPSLAQASGKELPRILEGFVARCLEKAPEKRFEDMEDVIDALDACEKALETFEPRRATKPEAETKSVPPEDTTRIDTVEEPTKVEATNPEGKTEPPRVANTRFAIVAAAVVVALGILFAVAASR